MPGAGDLSHFASKRKARVGDDVLLVLDEFAAVQAAPSKPSTWRLLHTVGGGLVLHPLPDPDVLVRLAGTIRVPERAWQLDPGGPAGQARVHMSDRPRIDPNQVRQLHPGDPPELNRRRAIDRWRRWRRTPGFLRVLVRVAHLGRVRHG